MQSVVEKRIGYDLSRFDRRMVVREQVEKEQTAARNRRRAQVKAKPIVSGFAVFSSVVVFLMLIALLFSHVSLNEAADINRQKREQLESLKEKNRMLEISCNQKIDEYQIREYAVTKLGMSKIDKSQITYVTTSGGDRFEVGKPKEKSPFLSGIASGFSRMIEFIN